MFSASGHHLVAKDEQEITQDGERLWKKTKKKRTKLKLCVHKQNDHKLDFELSRYIISALELKKHPL